MDTQDPEEDMEDMEFEEIKSVEATFPAPSVLPLQSEQSIIHQPKQLRDGKTRKTRNKRLRPDKTISPTPSCTSLQSDQSMDRPIKFREGTQHGVLRPDKTISPTPSCTSLQSDQSMDRPIKFREGTQHGVLRPFKTISPTPSCTSVQSDQSMDRPIKFREGTQHGVLRPDKTISPTPSCTSLQSDQSMDRPIKFREGTQHGVLRPDKTISPTPSCTSVQSDQSMDRPIKFREGTQHGVLRPDKTISPTPSCTSLQSDQSMDRPIKFHGSTQNARLRPDKTISPTPSCTSVQSDQSMDRPIKFQEGTQHGVLRPDKTISPTPSCTSLQSDQSMDRPIKFREGTQHGVLRPFKTISPTPSCTSVQSDQSMDRPIKFREGTQHGVLRPDKTISPTASCTSLQSDQSMDRPIKFREGTQHGVLRPDKTISPTPSFTSLQSDQSMDRPIKFREGTQHGVLRPDKTISPTPSCTSLQSDQSMDRPIKFHGSTQNARLRPDEVESPAPSCISVQSDQSMDRPIKFQGRTQNEVTQKTVKEPSQTHDDSLRLEVMSPDISAFSATLLTEDHYRCSVCTEVFKNPVSIPCGHSYCKHCIEIYWNKPTQAEYYACPQCRKRFRDLPVLNVNVALAKLIEELKRAGFSPALPDHCYAGSEDVSCDICSDKKLKAVKTCLTCCVSYCESHIRQHYTVPALQRHHLSEPCKFDQKTTKLMKRFQEENKVLAATVTKQKLTRMKRAKRFCRTFEIHGNDLPLEIIEVAALGRPLGLGMLYDTKSDSYNQAAFLWNDSIIASMRVSLPRPQSDAKFLECDSLKDRFRALEISPVLRTRVLNGELKVNGAAAFLNHPFQSEHQDRVTLHYKTTTRLDMISQTLLQEGVSPSLIKTTTATHVIIAVSYGAQAFFVFDDQQNSPGKKTQMKDVLKKISSFCASQIDLCLNDREKALSLFYKCSLYIDVGDWKSPVSFDKALEIYSSLPELLGSIGVPLKVWLYPLKKLDKTSACAAFSKHLKLRAEKVMEHLNKQIRKCQDFMTSPDNLSVIICCSFLKDKLVEFSDLLQQYQADFQDRISEIAEDIQIKEEEEEESLCNLLERHDLSPFRAENIYKWLEIREAELKIFNDCKAADINVVKSQTELQQIINHPQTTRVMCFTLTSPDVEDSFLTGLKQHVERDHTTSTNSLQFMPVTIDKKVLTDMQLYIAAKEENEDTEQTKFVASSVPDNVFPEYSVQYYYMGRIVSRNITFGIKLHPVQIAQIKHRSVSLELNHLLKKDIQRCVMEYRVTGHNERNNNTWKQITQTFTEKFVMSGLEPDTEYQLKYAVCDNQCMSNFSSNIYFKTSTVARPGPPSVTKLNKDILRVEWLKAEFDEDCPVLHYKIEYREAGLEGWSSVQTQGSQCEYTLIVSHITCYRVRVSAVYEDITSKPSEETSVPVEVWRINLSETKSSIILEVLKRQTEKKPVELIDWTHEESEVRGFLQCLPYISQLRFCKDTLKKEEKKKSSFQFLINVIVAASERDTNTEKTNTELVTSVFNYTSFPCEENCNDYFWYQIDRCDFLLGLYSQVKNYESETGMSVLPALQSIYHQSPEVWRINLSKKKSSILLEVLKLHTEKKPVDLIDWTHEESEVREFLQCLPYISQLSFIEPSSKSLKQWKQSKRLFIKNLYVQAALCQQETIETTGKMLLSSVDNGKCDFLLDLCSHVKNYESETGRSVLPALQSIYHQSPEVWRINLSERKSSILLEVLKLQTEKKPVELIDWTHEESEVREFLQCLPYISQLRFESVFNEKRESAVKFLVNLFIEASAAGENYTELFKSVCSYTTFPFDEYYYDDNDFDDQIERWNFLLYLHSYVKDYESKTGMSVLPALESIYQLSPKVWRINLSERKSSILLEVLKLQTEKKPVELIDWTHEESEVREFLQYLPYISELRFCRDILKTEEKKKSSFQFLINLILAASEFDKNTENRNTQLLISVFNYTTFPCDEDDEDFVFPIEQCDFLLELYLHVKNYESETGRSVLPALQSIYHQSPEVWRINLSERKSSILLEVLKLQTEKKPVELRGWTHEESKVKGFIQCLPYISQLRYTSFPCDDLILSLQCDFLLDLYSHVKNYESETGMSVLPALQSIYHQLSPEVWRINLSKRKSSILLEVLKLQTEKKPVELIDWTHEESEVRGFLQCLPYISQLRFIKPPFESPELWEVKKRFHILNIFLQEALCQKETIETTVKMLLSSVKYEQCDFLLDLYLHVKNYESKTGRSVLPALQSIYHQLSPEVWRINLSKRKSSILLEVLKLQTEKKPVELIDWTDEESEVREFLQCLPYISQLRFIKPPFESPELWEVKKRFHILNIFLQEALCQKETIETTVKMLLSSVKYEQCDFLLDLYLHVKNYESKTGRSVLPALQSIYHQLSPEVWRINLSKRKSSILLEVLKLQTEKKPVELIDWTHEESEVRGFLQCLPYISQLRFIKPPIESSELWEVKKRFHILNIILQEALCQKETIETTVKMLLSSVKYEQCGFLLDLYLHVKNYESKTGRSVLPALQSIYHQLSPEVWRINLSKRKSSILLEVLKLQTEKKPVELIDWTHEESEVREFLQCLPYISQLRFTYVFYKKRESMVQFLVNLFTAASEIDTNTKENYTELLSSVCSYTTFPFDENYYNADEYQSDFLLDLYLHGKNYESQTGRSVLPALQSIYHQSPEVWRINLSKRKSSILLEVLKLQTEKKPVELIDWTDEESEVREFLQCLPYISQLRFTEVFYEKRESMVQFLVNLFTAASEIDTNTKENYTELLSSVCSYTTFPFDENYYNDEDQMDQCDFLLDLCSQVKNYESKTCRSVIPALKSIYHQLSLEVWFINLSKRKSSILLEVLKLQTEKKPVELIDWTHEESEVREFLQCLPYISQLRNAEMCIPSLCKVLGSKVKRDEVTPLLQALKFTVTLCGKLPSSTCKCVGRVLRLSTSNLNLTLKPQAISLRGLRSIFRHITHLKKLCLEDRMVMMMVRGLRSVNADPPLSTDELSVISKDSNQTHCRIVSSLTSLLRLMSVRSLDLTECKLGPVSVTALLCLQGLKAIRLSTETLQQLVSVVYEAQDDELTRCFMEKVSRDLTSCSLTWKEIQYLLQYEPLPFKVDVRKCKIPSENMQELVPWLNTIQLKRSTPSLILSIIMEIYESRSSQFVSGLLSSTENYINLKSRVLDSVQCAALRFILQNCNAVKLNLFWTSIPDEEIKNFLPLLNRVTQLSVDRQLLLKLLHCCSSSDDPQQAADLLLSALQNKLDFSSCSSLDLTVTQEEQNCLNLTIKDCRRISSVLRKTENVKLILEDCKVSDKALKKLLPILSHVHLSCGKDLLLQFLNFISKGTKRRAIRWSQALSQALGEELDLSHIQIDQRVCEQLAMFLEYSDGLKELDLSHCKLNDQNLKTLLPHLHKTQTLNLSHNNISDDLANRIHSVVSTHNNIQTVRLFGNKIKDRKLFFKDKRFEIW